MKKAIIITSSIIVTVILIIFLILKYIIFKPIPSIQVIIPKKTEYYIGEKASFNDLEVYIIDGDKKIEINDYEITGFDSSKEVEKQLITISCFYKNNTYTYNFYINIKTIPSFNYLVSIEIYSNPQTIYSIGEDFNEKGGKLKCIYNDGTYKIVNLLYNYVFGFSSDKAGTFDILIKYYDKGKTFTTNLTVEIINETI